MTNEQVFARLFAENRDLKRMVAEARSEYAAFLKACQNTPRSITAEIDSIPGRRIYYNLNQVATFTAADAGLRGAPLNFLVSQDGPFIMTHYPLVMWKSSAPDNATDFGRWRPISSWPLPDQVLDTNIIDLSYEIVDGGSQRNFQNLPNPPMFCTPDTSLPLPVPTLFAPNSVIQFFPTFEAITFGGSTATTAGILSVSLPGYRIVNM